MNIEESKKYLKNLIRNGNINDAEKYIDKLINSTSDKEEKEDWLFVFAEELYYDDRYDEAIACFEKIINTTSSSEVKSEAFCYIGQCYNEKDNHNTAIEFLNKVLNYNPSREILLNTYSALASSFLNLKQYNKAINCHHKVIELCNFPNNELEKEIFENSYLFLIMCYWKSGNENKSDEYFNKLIAMHNLYPHILANAYGIMGHRYYEKNDFNNAREHYIKAIDLSENHADANKWKDYLNKVEEELKM